MKLPLKIGSRFSPLACVQVKEVLQLLGDNLPYEHITFKTKSDADKITSLTTQPADDFFTNTLDEAILNEQIDIAIHSAKDIPKDLAKGLLIYALTPPLDTTDAWVSSFEFINLPKHAKVGTSSLLRQKQILELRPDLTIIDIRGTIEERIALVKNKTIDGLIVATCALKRLGLTELITSIFPWEGMALQGQLAVVGRDNNHSLAELFKGIDVRQRYGRVTLVGAGPGDPDLITIKGKNALQQADCVFYDYLVDKNLLKYAPKAQHIYAGKRKGDHTLSQEDLSKMLRIEAMKGRSVVRLKGGDPLIFGRGADEIQYLNSYHIDVDTVPGISSATGIASSLGIPLTARGIASSVAFISGHEEDEDVTGIKPIVVPNADTVIFFMGLTKLNEIIKALLKINKPITTPVLIISKGTRQDEQIVIGTLANIESLVIQHQIKPPALIITGDIANFYKPKSKKTFLHCGTNPELYNHLGKIIPWPMIQIETIVFNEEQNLKLVEDFNLADFILLTSPTSVKHFMTMILKLRTFEEIRSKVFAVIGQHSAQVLRGFGIHAQIISNEETAQGFFKTLKSIIDLKNKQFLFPRSSLPNPFLKDALEHEGAIISEHRIYSNTKPVYRELNQHGIDGIIFTSPSTVKNFLDDYQQIPNHLEILAKGPVTHNALNMAGYSSKIIS